MVVARESSTTDLPLLEGMIAQTLQMYPELPGQAELVRAGATPVKDWKAFGGSRMQRGKTTAVLFQVQDTLCLYSQGSASKSDVDQDNGFCALLIEIINEYQPRTIYIATFSRLVRSPYFSGPVMQAMAEKRCQLRCREETINPRSTMGRAMWQMLAMFASMERDAILTRMVLGRLHRHRTGRWHRTANALPLGYRLDRDGRPEVDPHAVPHVRRMLGLLGDPTLSSRDIVDVLGREGLVLPGQRRGHGRRTAGPGPRTGAGPTGQGRPDDGLPVEERPTGGGADDPTDTHDVDVDVADGPPDGRTVADYYSPAEVVARWYSHIDTYRTGRLDTWLASPIDGPDKFAEYRLAPDPRPGKEGQEAIALPVRLPLPPGGWAEDQVFEAALHNRESNRNRQHPGPGELRMPLLGPLSDTQDDSYRYRLWSRTLPSGPGLGYELRRQALDDVPRPGSRTWRPPSTGWHPGNIAVGEGVALVHSDALHESVADGVAAAIRDGLALSPRTIDGADEFRLLTGGQPAPVHAADRARRLADELADAAAAKTRARERVQAADRVRDRSPEDTEFAAEAESLLRQAMKQVSRLTRELADAREHQDAPPQPAPTEVHSPAGLLLAALAGLRNCPDRGSTRLNRALNVVLTDLAFTWDGIRVHWSVRVKIPADGSFYVTAPVTGSVPQLNRGRGPDRHGARTRDGLAAWMTGQAEIQELLHAAADTGQSERKRWREELERLGMTPAAAAVVVLLPIPVARATVWSLLHETPLPENADAGYAALMADAYLGARPLAARNQWYFSAGSRAWVSGWLLEQGGSASRSTLVQALREAGLSPMAARYLTLPAYGVPFLVPSSDPCPTPNTPGRCSLTTCARHGTISLRRCTTCTDGFASHPLGVWECPEAALCPDCRRMPGSQAEFPADYLLVTAAWREAELNRHAPDLGEMRRQGRKGGTASPTRLSALRAWAVAQGYEPKARGRLHAHVVRAWEQAGRPGWTPG